MYNLTFQHLAHLCGMTEAQANQHGYCRAELIKLLTNH